jgi:hypothetical protein
VLLIAGYQFFTENNIKSFGSLIITAAAIAAAGWMIGDL